MTKTLKTLNLIFFIAMIAINALANLLPIGIGSTGEISMKYPNLFTPAPVTFAIWGLIYLLVAVFSVFQLGIIGNMEIAEKLVDRVSIWFIISCIMNIGWIFSWHYDITWLSMVFMIGLLCSLIILASRINPNSFEYIADISDMPFTAKLSIYGFDIYLGWITAATIANASVFLVKLNWNGFMLTDQFWMIIILIVGSILGILFIAVNQRYLSAAAIVWAYSGILIRHISQSGYAGKYPLIIGTTIIGIVAILAAGIVLCMIND